MAADVRDGQACTGTKGILLLAMLLYCMTLHVCLAQTTKVLNVNLANANVNLGHKRLPSCLPNDASSSNFT